jgi:hypothetical protein
VVSTPVPLVRQKSTVNMGLVELGKKDLSTMLKAAMERTSKANTEAMTVFRRVRQIRRKFRYAL